MRTAKILDCTVYFQSFFPKAIPFSTQGFEALALRLLEAFASDGLNPADFTLNKGDELFSYSLKVRLFNDLLFFMLDATHVEISFKNIRRSSDREIVLRCLDNFTQALDHLDIKTAFLNVKAHTALGSTEIRDQYLQGFGRPEAGFTMGGGLLYKTENDFCKLLRLEVDQSYTFSDAVFIDWRASDFVTSQLFAKPDIWEHLFRLAEIFDLHIEIDERPA
jgi:hypothetical protein